MQVWTAVRSIGVWCAAVAIAGGLGVSGASPAMAEEGTGNQVFFKGGFMNLNHDRGNQTFTDVGGGATGTNGGNAGWYAGAGLDLVMSKNAWGAVDKTWVVGEIGLQFNRINSARVNNAIGYVTTSTNDMQQVQLTMMTINVSPKIKFMEGSAFRPWIIPIGLDFHVISPPSNRTQYLDMGVQFGAGFEMQVWKAFMLGVDARYHLTARMTNTNNDYFQVGPYVGISF
ncbi:MAG: hypothetical protein RI101_09655 [Nitrospira sp.]|jgi:hypothetical protein|nr:hypothetical protein [Nitrospira sp.]